MTLPTKMNTDSMSIKNEQTIDKLQEKKIERSTEIGAVLLHSPSS